MLSQANIAQFDQRGYLKLPQAIAPNMLEQLRIAADQAEQYGFEALKRNEAPKDYAFTHSFLTPFLNRLTQYHLYTGAESMVALGAPIVLEAAQSLCGEQFLPTVDMLILKNQYDHLNLPWHQDLIYDWQKYRVIALGIYLEDAKSGDGALKLVNNSQFKKHDIDQLMQDSTIDIVEIPATAGDIIIHNPMLVHWSDMLEQQSQRRTLYYEFRPIAQVKEEESWPQHIIDQRLGLLASALSQFKQQYPESQSFVLPKEHPLHDLDMVNEHQALYRARIPFNTANFAKSLLDQVASRNK